MPATVVTLYRASCADCEWKAPWSPDDMDATNDAFQHNRNVHDGASSSKP